MCTAVDPKTKTWTLSHRPLSQLLVDRVPLQTQQRMSFYTHGRRMIKWSFPSRDHKKLQTHLVTCVPVLAKWLCFCKERQNLSSVVCGVVTDTCGIWVWIANFKHVDCIAFSTLMLLVYDNVAHNASLVSNVSYHQNDFCISVLQAMLWIP